MKEKKITRKKNKRSENRNKDNMQNHETLLNGLVKANFENYLFLDASWVKYTGRMKRGLPKETEHLTFKICKSLSHNKKVTCFVLTYSFVLTSTSQNVNLRLKQERVIMS